MSSGGKWRTWYHQQGLCREGSRLPLLGSVHSGRGNLEREHLWAAEKGPAESERHLWETAGVLSSVLQRQHHNILYVHMSHMLHSGAEECAPESHQNGSEDCRLRSPDPGKNSTTSHCLKNAQNICQDTSELGQSLSELLSTGSRRHAQTNRNVYLFMCALVLLIIFFRCFYFNMLLSLLNGAVICRHCNCIVLDKIQKRKVDILCQGEEKDSKARREGVGLMQFYHGVDWKIHCQKE